MANAIVGGRPPLKKRVSKQRLETACKDANSQYTHLAMISSIGRVMPNWDHFALSLANSPGFCFFACEDSAAAAGVAGGALDAVCAASSSSGGRVPSDMLRARAGSAVEVHAQGEAGRSDSGKQRTELRIFVLGGAVTKLKAKTRRRLHNQVGTRCLAGACLKRRESATAPAPPALALSRP